ncbi:hypothetical protein HZZ00_11705 [Streptomyces sp. NEAU-sy36]|uniref:hypothetical protein n=1 Tax=unclassified Streptomyces TaxID=2593676 RepID=UPI0015D5F0E3|nr:MULTISPECIES: hypothetical protein [unclassified Streptomyces]QLJ01623.1 hypothetical protein HZZ00_11705 [Streptomyces sp. NEAU-sy36]
MHRTTTTAALLVTVAVSALSGCVTVRHTAAPGPPPGALPSRQTAPRTDGSASPREVQAPAREALEMVGPSGKPGRARESAPHGSPAAPPPTPAGTPPRSRPQPHRTAQAPPRTSQQVPADVCDLGREYGGWRGNSPESEICERTYGRH